MSLQLIEICAPWKVPQNDEPLLVSSRAHSFDGNYLFFTGYRVQTNALTSYIDANFVYGSNEKIGSLLREFKEGKLRTMPIYEGLKPILPLKKFQPDDGCIRPHRDLFCFLAGEKNYFENPQLCNEGPKGHANHLYPPACQRWLFIQMTGGAYYYIILP